MISAGQFGVPGRSVGVRSSICAWGADARMQVRSSRSVAKPDLFGFAQARVLSDSVFRNIMDFTTKIVKDI